MTVLIDTNIAIHVRDGDEFVLNQIAALGEPFAISVVARAELEGGVDRLPAFAARRRAKLDDLVATVDVFDFGQHEAAAYGRIVAVSGYSGSRTLDRMIAATAIVRGTRLVTINGDDFRGIDGLAIETWTGTPDRTTP